MREGGDTSGHGLIIKIPEKYDMSLYHNGTWITLLSVPSKVLSRIILKRIKEVVDSRRQTQKRA